jgi:hypothetical protein
MWNDPRLTGSVNPNTDGSPLPNTVVHVWRLPSNHTPPVP